MANMDLTVQVLDLSPKVTFTDLNTFFSYCGTVDKITLERKEDHSQLAYVTFRQPYALQTALLLNNAVIVDRPVRILSIQNMESPSVSRNSNNMIKKTEMHGFIPAVNLVVQMMATIGSENLNKAREVLDEKYKISDKGNELTLRTRMAISAAEKSVERAGEEILNNKHFSNGALWVSAALHKAAKYAAELGNHDKRKNPNSRKQK